MICYSIKRAAKSVFLLVLAAIGLVGASRISTEPPRPASVFPLPGSDNVPGVRIQIAFNRPIDPESMSLDVWLRSIDGTTASVAGAIELNESHTAAVFRSYEPLPVGEILVRNSTGGDAPHEWRFGVTEKAPLHLGRGGPILLVVGANAPFGSYVSEILRAEGFANFSTVDGRELLATAIGNHRLVIVTGNIPAEAAAKLRAWVSDGGNLILVRPSGDLADLAGVRAEFGLAREGYLAIDTGHAPGKGLVTDSIQYHGSADIYATDADTRTLATISKDLGGPQTPALTVRTVGTMGGEVAAFAFDLPQSIVLTRQGNPQWAGQDRDGLAPIRPNDLFYGLANSDPQPDFVDLSRASIPQADEQMRLLTNLIQYLQRDDAPIPRFWYFPRRNKAVLVMAADDHGTKRGTQDSFNRMLALDEKNCDASRWECARATSWLYPFSGLDNRAAENFAAKGFDIGSHVSTHCKNWSATSLDLAFAADMQRFRSAYPSLPLQQGSRLHCIVWSDFVTQANIGRNWGIRFDMNYYYWPRNWVKGRAGFMTGSGIPMRFSSAGGQLINVYQQETHLVDEVFYGHPDAVERLIQRALGPEQYYGAFGTHYDFHNAFDTFLMALAVKYDVPMVSAQQMLDWQDGKAQSDILRQRWDGENLDFTIVPDERTQDMLTVMLPWNTHNGRLIALTRDGVTVAVETEVIKGVKYGLFPGLRGNYRANYRNDVSVFSEQ
jgi:hypothetical protein